MYTMHACTLTFCVSVSVCLCVYTPVHSDNQPFSPSLPRFLPPSIHQHTHPSLSHHQPMPCSSAISAEHATRPWYFFYFIFIFLFSAHAVFQRDQSVQSMQHVPVFFLFFSFFCSQPMPCSSAFNQCRACNTSLVFFFSSFLPMLL